MKEKVLVVDDDVKILYAFEELLSRDGHTGITATNGEQALKILETIDNREPADVMNVSYCIRKVASPSAIEKACKEKLWRVCGGAARDGETRSPDRVEVTEGFNTCSHERNSR